MGGGKNPSSLDGEWKEEELTHSSMENHVDSDTEEAGQRLWQAAEMAALLQEKAEANEAEKKDLLVRNRILRSRLARARGRLNSYTPGSFMGKKPDKFKIPEVTTLLVVGLRGCGKSSVINHIIRALDVHGVDSYCAPLSGSANRAYRSLFLSEYVVCNGTVSLFDTRGFHGTEAICGTKVPEEWMTKGVRDGQREARDHDSPDFLTNLKLRGRNVDCMRSKRRDVNFVIFVVNIASFMAMKTSGDDRGLANLKALYDNPYFSFRDDRPVLVITHSEMLDLEQKNEAQVSLQNLLQVPRIEQIYDISGPTLNPYDDFKEDVNRAIMSEINVLEMLIAAVKNADRHLPPRGVYSSVFRTHRCRLASKSDRERMIQDLDDKLFLWLKICAAYAIVVSMIYLLGVFARTHKVLLKYVLESLHDANTLTIVFPWWGKKMRF